MTQNAAGATPSPPAPSAPSATPHSAPSTTPSPPTPPTPSARPTLPTPPHTLTPFAAIVVAAGKGLRSGQSVPKQFAPFRGKPLLRHSLESFSAWGANPLILVIPEGMEAQAREAAGEIENLHLIIGGESRQESVIAALSALTSLNAPQHVLIHDAARPFIPIAVVKDLLLALGDAQGAIPTLPIADSVSIESEGQMDGAMDREKLRRVQTPQAFRFADILAAHQSWLKEKSPDQNAKRDLGDAASDAGNDTGGDAASDAGNDTGGDAASDAGNDTGGDAASDAGNDRGGDAAKNAASNTASDTSGDAGGNTGNFASDDAQVLHWAGGRIAHVKGAETLKKMTYSEDFMNLSPSIRTGFGYDVHRLEAGEELWLCGVKIPHDRGLSGHSDADVALHALVDALFGAIAAGDIGDHFPPSDPQWKGADSARFVDFAVKKVTDSGYRIGNVDLTIICQNPRIAPHREAMKTRVARLLDITLDSVSIKATTTEGLGFTGREEGIAAQALVTVMN